MAYIYQVSFDIRPDQMDQLQIGGALERVLGYLKTLLPVEDGYVTARAMSSLDSVERTHLVFESIWENWEDLESHRNSRLSENKVLAEFEPHVQLEHVTTHIYTEVS
jgi:quinol monooxygenase YgiN